MRNGVYRDRTTSKPCLRHQATVSVDLDGADIARLFCCCDDYQMAQFFNQIAEEFAKTGSSFVMQMEHVSQQSVLSDQGRQVMQFIGEYAETSSGITIPAPQSPKPEGSTND